MARRGKGLSVCPYCIKDFKTPSLLQRHITVHTKEKKYVCVCGRGYTRPDRYRKHLETCAHGIRLQEMNDMEEDPILIEGVHTVTEQVHSSDNSPWTSLKP